MQLSGSALADLGKNCDLPTRDLAAQRVGIVHIEPGAFHRAHQALATEICLEAGQKDWAICGVSLRSAAFSEQLTEQHGLYGVLERGDVHDRLRIIGAIDHALSLKTSWDDVLLKSVLTNFAQHTGDAALVGIIQSMSFPSSMVDRITPATTASDISFVSDEYGVSDKCLVVAEPFFQWVIEDDFPMGRPDWTLAGSEFASDVIGLGLAIVIRACGLRNDAGDATHFSDPDIGLKIPRLDFSKPLTQAMIAPYLGREVETNQVMHWLGVPQRDGLPQTLRHFNQNMT